MNKHDKSRRYILGLALASPLAGLAGQAMAQAACVPETLSAAQQSMRKSLGFKLSSDNPARTCGGCAFYSGVGEASCGRCQLLNGPVPPTGVCSSWAAGRQTPKAKP